MSSSKLKIEPTQAERMEREELEKVEKEGEVSLEDYQKALEVLGPEESLKFLASVPVKEGEGKNLTVLTNTRLIFQKKGRFMLLEGGEGIEDFPYERIIGIDTEKRKKYDLLKVETEEKQREFMVPKGKGPKIAAIIRSLGEEKRREESSVGKLEKLSRLKEKGHVTEKEFNKKKKELLEEI